MKLKLASVIKLVVVVVYQVRREYLNIHIQKIDYATA